MVACDGCGKMVVMARKYYDVGIFCEKCVVKALTSYFKGEVDDEKH